MMLSILSPFGLSLSKADRAAISPFDKLRANGWECC
jgi:hypothetical protein